MTSMQDENGERGERSEYGMDRFRELQKGDRFELDGTEWGVHRTYDEYGPKCEYDRVLECYKSPGACRLFVVYPTEVRKTMGFDRMNRGDYEVVAESPQQTLVTDGGTDQPDPEEDPFACSLCGCYIGQFSGDYCDGCAREIGVKPPLRRCTHCGQRGPEEQMKAIDVSLPDEYYPTFEYLCRGCSGGESA